MRKKIISVVSVLSLLVGILVLGTTVLAQEKITLRFPNWMQAPFHRATLIPHIERFERAHPNIDVDFQIINYMEVQDMILRAGVLGDLPAEVIQAEVYHAIPLADLGFAEPLNDFLEKNKYLYEQAPKDVWDSWTYKGNIVGWAYNMGEATYLAYKKNTVEEAGVDPEDITTWDTFLNAAQKLQADTTGDGKIDRWGFLSLVGDVKGAYRTSLADFVFGNGGEFLRQENDKWYSNVADEKVVQAVQFWSDLNHKYGLLPPDIMGYDMKGMIKALGEGKAGLVQCWASLGVTFGKIGWFTGVEWQYDLRGIPVPAGPQGTKPVSSYDPGGWIINAKRSEEVKDAAKELMRHMIHESYTGALMGNRPVYEWGMEVFSLMGPLFEDAAEITSTYGRHVNYNLPEALSIQYTVIAGKIQEIFNKKQDVRQALEELDEEITDILKKAGRQ